MNKINWSEYKFHCSSIGKIMTGSRSKTEPLGKTVQSYLNELYLEEAWGRKKPDMEGNKYTQKGIMCETDSLELLEKVTGQKCFKNQKTFQNDWIVGTPDVDKPNLIDIKTSWDLFTFMKVNYDTARADYYYQLLGYMWLLGLEESSLIYGLVNTPNTMISDEIYRLTFKVATEEEADKYRVNYIFDDIPEKSRIKRYEFKRSDQDIISVKMRIADCRVYLSNLTI